MTELKLNPSKCNLFYRKVSYIRHVMSAKDRQTNFEKISAVANCNRSEDVHQLRSFRELCTWNRRYVKGFSNLTRPFHKLTEINKKLLWTDECEDVIKKLKESLRSAPVLTYPQPDKLFILDTDVGTLFYHRWSRTCHSLLKQMCIQAETKLLYHPGKIIRNR